MNPVVTRPPLVVRLREALPPMAQTEMNSVMEATHSGFKVMDFRYSALFLLSDFKSAPLFFGKSYNKNQNCSETSMDRSLR